MWFLEVYRRKDEVFQEYLAQLRCIYTSSTAANAPVQLAAALSAAASADPAAANSIDVSLTNAAAAIAAL